MRIKTFEFIPGFLGGKLPVNRESFFGTLFGPLLSNLVKVILRGNALLQALPAQDRKLTFGHVQPTAVYRRVMERYFLGQGSRLLWHKRLIEGHWRMGAQVV